MGPTRTILTAGVALALSGGAAHAADLAVADPLYPTAVVTHSGAYDWSGFYAGVSAGYAGGSASLDGAGGEVEFSGPTAGIQFGLNTQSETVVVGAEADLQFGLIGDDGDASEGADLDYVAGVRGRVGLALDDVLPYLTAGLAVGQASMTDSLGVSDTETHVGWSAGLGTEFAFDQNTSLRVEYLYTDLGERTYDLTEPTEGGLDYHSVRAGMNFSF
ncbi:outer membrane protein [Pelagibacterium montanilacus]|uniref:outer membrane protein n=1 Tax=Pelagibacterium montanilacus TaxID=2185280 RepID=UPI000F8DBD78|nr:outer membrane beta-barrel protein [Pelagibacterium montanilacus]